MYTSVKVILKYYIVYDKNTLELHLYINCFIQPRKTYNNKLQNYNKSKLLSDFNKVNKNHSYFGRILELSTFMF